MKGYVAQKGDRWYAVIYQGLDPITGRERRSWHPAGPAGPTPSSSPPGWPPSATGATTRHDHSRSAPTSSGSGFKATLSVNRGLVAVGYEVHETRGKTRNARRRVDLDPSTVEVLTAWRKWQRVEQQAIGLEPSDRMFTEGHGAAIHPHAISQAYERICRRASVRVIRLHDYADVRVMPTSVREPLRGRVIRLLMSA